MVCTANDLLEWKDFPRGLRVLLLDEDDSSAAEMKSKLEEMDYIVSLFHNENEAFSAIADKSESFHVAIVEINSDNGNGRFKFLENVKDLPTVMISDMHCLNTMMKCIALGAVEFLRKPLSKERLKNIWQHVAHKAFNASRKGRSELLKPVKESVVPMLQPNESTNSIPVEGEEEFDKEKNREISAASDKYPAPSTPQLKQAVRSLDDGDCQDQSNFSTEKESMDQDGESKSVDTTCGSSGTETAVRLSPAKREAEDIIKEEDVSMDNSRGANNESPLPENKDCPDYISGNASELVKASGTHNSSATKSNRKKMKVDWTPELHKNFVQAVEQLGMDQAIPSRILEHMKVDGLTRHNVASHLQKYRMHHRRILPKEEDRRWPQARDSASRSYYPLKPIMAFPPYQSNYALSTSHVYPAWGPPSNYPAGVQMWPSPYYHAWQSTENMHWKPSYSEMHADAWGCPVMPPQLGPHPSFPQNASAFRNADMMQSSCSMPEKSFDFHTSQEVIDKVVKEAISKPRLPLPLGLKPPSIDSVLTELSKQGISTIPPHINRSCHL